MAQVLRTLTYHRIAEPGGQRSFDLRTISATPGDFRRQMTCLASHYTVVSMSRVVAAVSGQKRLPKRAVLITFDDAYDDFSLHAWPVLKSLGMPATLFVPTAYPDAPRSFWWDRLHRCIITTALDAISLPGVGRVEIVSGSQRLQAVRRLQEYAKRLPHHEAVAFVDEVCSACAAVADSASPVLGWKAIRAMAAEGLTLAPHSRTHPIMTQIPESEAEIEILESRNDLLREAGCASPVFCYPDGRCNQAITTLLRKHGFSAAFTTREGHSIVGRTDPMRLRRTTITRRTTMPVFRLRLLRGVAPLDACRQRIKEYRSLYA